jgi:predicted Zn-dependent peptidase
LTFDPFPLLPGRKQLKAEYLMSMESSEGLLEEMGAQALSSGAYHSPETVTQSIDSVSHADVVNVSTLQHSLLLGQEGIIGHQCK